MAQAVHHNGYRFQSPTMNLSARPNVYKRSLEARDFTNAYLAEVERKAAGVDEPTPTPLRNRVWLLAAVILFGMGLSVAMVVLH